MYNLVALGFVSDYTKSQHKTQKHNLKL